MPASHLFDLLSTHSHFPVWSPADGRVPGGGLLDAADHELDEGRLLSVVKRFFLGPRLLEQQVRHALPVLHHGVAVDQGVDQVRAVHVQLMGGKR